MKVKKIASIAVRIAFLISVVGCTQQKTATISKPNITMKTVTQESDSALVKFTCDIPEGWDILPMNYFSVFTAEQSNIEKNYGSQEEGLPYVLLIGNYLRSGGAGTQAPEDVKQAYQELFSGNPEKLKNFINTYISSIKNESKISSSELDQFGMPESKSNNENLSSEHQYLKDFKYKDYIGKNGKITEIQYSFDYKGKTYHQIRCIRQDIPYMTLGGFDESINLSTGQIALWVADSLEVTENYAMKDGSVVKKS